MIVYRDEPTFLIDECLTPDLVAVARDRGYDARHAKDAGFAGRDDITLAVSATEDDDIFVTNNARDFRRIYARFRRHPGLVIILPSTSAAKQCALFQTVLIAIETSAGIENALFEIDANGTIKSRPWPQAVSPQDTTD